MPILIELKRYLIAKTQLKFNISYQGARNFVEAIEQGKGLVGYEDQLEKAKEFKELFNYYFDNRCVIKEA